ncbi:MAG TPA: caspase family protein [Bradyrhizobium sp.]|nr:caspase family protein [Bradyrhizobium sp.]
MRALSRLAGLFCIIMAAMNPSQGLSQGAAKPAELKPCGSNAQPDENIEACTAALSAPNLERKSRATYLRSRGYAYNNKLQYDRAFEDFDAAAELFDDPELKYNVLQSRGFSLSLMGRPDEAKKQFDEIIQYRRRSGDADKLATAIASLAYVDLRLGEYGSALATFREAEGLAPKNTAAIGGIALASRHLGDLDTSISQYSRLIELSPSDFGAVANRGEAKRLKGDLDGALSDLNKAIDMKDMAFVRLYRGRIFRYTGEVDKALADFSFAIGQAPDMTPAYVDRGLTYERMGELEKARADYRKALTTSSYNSVALAREAKESATARLAALDKGAPNPPVKRPLKESRVALVIGNSRYQSVAALPNSGNDAGAVARTLRAIGFQTVNLASDTSREVLVNELRKFAEKAESADWALIYYAGHGIEIGGINYLIPVDAKLASDRDVQFEAVALDQVLASVEGARKLKLVVLDACRINPFESKMRRTVATRSVGRGLTRVEPEGATLVVFAAKHGQTALDGTGGNSPFAQALVNRLATPDVEINKVFRLVRDDVMEATAGRQEPFTYGSLPGKEDFFFVSK